MFRKLKEEISSKSLKFQFIFWTCISFIFSVAISSVISVYLFNGVVEKHISKVGDDVIDRLATTTPAHIWNMDTNQLFVILNSELSNAGVAAIHLKFQRTSRSVDDNAKTSSIYVMKLDGDKTKTGITKGYAGDYNGAMLANLKLKKSSLVYFEQKDAVAMLDVYLTKEEMHKLVFKGGLIFFINVVLLYLSLVFAMMYLLNHVFLSRLKHLIMALSDIETSDRIIPAKLDIVEDNEFGDVRKSINDVQDKFRTIITTSLRNERASLSAFEDLKKVQRTLIQSEKMAALGGVVAGVAHELNTPLGNSLVAVTTLIDHTGEFRQKVENNKLTKTGLIDFLTRLEEGLKLSFDSSYRAASLIEKFKQVAVDQTNDRIRSFKVSEIVAEALSILNSVLKKSKARIILDVDPKLQMTSYPGGMYQIISNIVANAVLHGLDGEPGDITISAHRIKEIVTIQIKDTGKGISAENLNKIFDPFFTTSFGKGGSGLGLHISQNEAAKLGGRLSVESEVGIGTTFTLTIDTSDRISSRPAPL